MRLRMIQLLDWFDHTVLQHRFYRVCQWIGQSTWWGYPVRLDDLTPEQARVEVNKRYPNYVVGSKYTAADIEVMKNSNANR